MPKPQLNLYQSACQKLRVSRSGPLTVLVVDGQGMALTLTADFSVVEKWAKSKQAGPNATLDMGKIMEKLEVLVARPGTSFASTRGSLKPLEAIVKGMRAAGMDTKEFQLPPELKDVRPDDPLQRPKPAPSAAADITAAPADPSQQAPFVRPLK